MIKRIGAIICGVLCSMLVVLPTFTHKTSQSDVVACAEEIIETPLPTYEGYYVTPLSTYNAINIYEGGAFEPQSLALAFNKDTCVVYMSQAYEINPALLTINLSKLYTYNVADYPTGYVYDVSLPVNTVYGLYYPSWEFLNNGCKMAIYTGSFGFKNMTEEEYREYIPVRTNHHFVYLTMDDVPYICMEYYVDYLHYTRIDGNVLESEYVRGLGFTIRLPLYSILYDGYTTFKSQMFYSVENAIPSTQYNVFNNYTMYSVSYDKNYENEVVSYLHGYLEGLDDGIGVKDYYWYNEGYDNGYIDGVAEHQNYTFIGLMSSVIDVPINALRSVLNFEILGFDMATFFFSLFTLSIVLTIVRMLL